MAGFLGSGDVYMGRMDEAGNIAGLVLVGNTTSFKITEASEFKERTSRGKSDYGQTLDSVAVKKPAALTVTIDDLRKENLALVLLGDQAAFSQTAATDTTKNFDLATVEKDYYLDLGKRLIVAGAVSVAVDSTPYTEGTDYEVNYDMGLILFKSTGSLPATGTAIATFDAAAITAGYTVTGGTNPTIKAKFVLDGVNLASSERCQVEVWEAVVTPTEGVDFLAADFSSVSFEGKLNKPTGKTSPYQVTAFPAAA